jgi:predicted transcriptional regulator
MKDKKIHKAIAELKRLKVVQKELNKENSKIMCCNVKDGGKISFPCEIADTLKKVSQEFVESRINSLKKLIEKLKENN